MKAYKCLYLVGSDFENLLFKVMRFNFATSGQNFVPRGCKGRQTENRHELLLSSVPNDSVASMGRFENTVKNREKQTYLHSARHRDSTL